jgi:hypothetical protein
MKITRYALDFAIMFAVVFVVNLTVTYLYGLIVHGSGVFDWGNAFTFGISLGILFPWIRRRDKKQGEK